MTEKWIVLLLLVLGSWIGHKQAEDSPPSRVDNFFMKFQFNLMSYSFGFFAFCLLISIIIDFLET